MSQSFPVFLFLFFAFGCIFPADSLHPRKQPPPSYREIQAERYAAQHVHSSNAKSGNLWPLPQQTNFKEKVLVVENFRFVVKGQSCAILDAAIQRYYQTIFGKDWKAKVEGKRDIPALNRLYVTVNPQNACHDSDLPEVDMDEHYEITIADRASASLLVGNTVWGVIRGLETFRYPILSSCFYVDCFDWMLKFVNY